MSYTSCGNANSVSSIDAQQDIVGKILADGKMRRIDYLQVSAQTKGCIQHWSKVSEGMTGELHRDCAACIQPAHLRRHSQESEPWIGSTSVQP